MRKTPFILLLIALGLWAAPAQAQTYYPFGSVNVGTASSGVRVGPFGCYSTTSSPTYTTGQIHPCSVTTTGGLRVVLIDAATGTPLTPSTDATAGSAASASGPQIMGDCDDTATVAGVENAAARVRVDCTSRAVYTRVLDPCSGLAKTHISINISTATTTELTPSLAGASTNYYVCSLDLVTAAANNVALTDDDSDGCGSVTSGLAGGTTAATGWNFVAGGGLVKGNGLGTVFKTAGTNRVLCLVTSAATQLSGSIEVVAAP